MKNSTINYCTEKEDLLKRFTDPYIVPLLKAHPPHPLLTCGKPVPFLGTNLERIDPVTGRESRTISISEKRWNNAFKEDLHGKLDVAGLYCFWLLDPPPGLAEENGTHWLQGKKYSADQDSGRLDLSRQRIGKGKKADGKDTTDDHIFHKVNWAFPEVHGRIPLYIGKTSHLFNRIKLHLSWPASFDRSIEVNLRKPDDKEEDAIETSTICKNNTSTQFRSCYEFLHRSVCKIGEEEDKKLINNHYRRIGLSIIPTPFADVADRFYWEDYLVGTYQPPFNVDSER